jgi:hypothetical protein
MNTVWLCTLYPVFTLEAPPSEISGDVRTGIFLRYQKCSSLTRTSKPFSRCPDTRSATCSVVPLALTRASSLARPPWSPDTHRTARNFFCRSFSNSLICGRAQDLPDLEVAGTFLLSSPLTPDCTPSCPMSRLPLPPSRLLDDDKSFTAGFAFMPARPAHLPWRPKVS